MKNLIKFELRKILTKRFSLISIAVILLFSFVLAFSTFQGMHAFDGKSTEGAGTLFPGICTWRHVLFCRPDSYQSGHKHS